MSGWGTWGASFSWSLPLVAVTVGIHVIGIVLIASALERLKADLGRSGRILDSAPGTTIAIVAVALWLAFLHGVECVVWGVAYVDLDAFSSPAGAMLYSVNSMTTRGASGLVAAPPWQMLGAIEAGDGMLTFGMSTAFLFYVMIRLLRSDIDLTPRS